MKCALVIALFVTACAKPPPREPATTTGSGPTHDGQVMTEGNVKCLVIDGGIRCAIADGAGKYVKIDGSKGIELPESINNRDLERAPIISITRSDVSFKGEQVAKVGEVSTPGKEWKIQELYDRLVVARRELEAASMPEEQKQALRGMVVLQADKNIEAIVLNRVMKTCYAAEFPNVMFAINKKGGTEPLVASVPEDASEDRPPAEKGPTEEKAPTKEHPPQPTVEERPRPMAEQKPPPKGDAKAPYQISVLVLMDGLWIGTTSGWETCLPMNGGEYDWQGFETTLATLKQQQPTKVDIEIAGTDRVIYQSLVSTMDAAIAKGFGDVGYVDPKSLTAHTKGGGLPTSCASR